MYKVKRTHYIKELGKGKTACGRPYYKADLQTVKPEFVDCLKCKNAIRKARES